MFLFMQKLASAPLPYPGAEMKFWWCCTGGDE